MYCNLLVPLKIQYSHACVLSPSFPSLFQNAQEKVLLKGFHGYLLRSQRKRQMQSLALLHFKRKWISLLQSAVQASTHSRGLLLKASNHWMLHWSGKGLRTWHAAVVARSHCRQSMARADFHFRARALKASLATFSVQTKRSQIRRARNARAFNHMYQRGTRVSFAGWKRWHNARMEAVYRGEEKLERKQMAVLVETFTSWRTFARTQRAGFTRLKAKTVRHVWAQYFGLWLRVHTINKKGRLLSDKRKKKVTGWCMSYWRSVFIAECNDKVLNNHSYRYMVARMNSVVCAPPPPTRLMVQIVKLPCIFVGS
jgi:hypothetical protein